MFFKTFLSPQSCLFGPLKLALPGNFSFCLRWQRFLSKKTRCVGGPPSLICFIDYFFFPSYATVSDVRVHFLPTPKAGVFSCFGLRCGGRVSVFYVPHFLRDGAGLTPIKTSSFCHEARFSHSRSLPLVVSRVHNDIYYLPNIKRFPQIPFFLAYSFFSQQFRF